MRALLQDLKYSFRVLLKNPWVSCIVVLSLALGIGVNTTIFTVFNGVFLNPLPVSNADELVSVYTVDQKFVDGPRGSHHPTSFPNFEDLRDRNRVFDHLAAYVALPLALRVGEEPQEVTGQAVTEGFFELMATDTAVGRFFSPEENGVNHALPVIVLSYNLWQQRFAGSPDVVGRSVSLNGRPFEVIGVARRGFIGPTLERTPDLWVPMMMRDALFSGPLRLYHGERRALMFWMVGRLNRGVELAQAEAGANIVAQQLTAEYPAANRDRTFTLVPLLESNIRPDQRQLLAKAGGVLLLVVASILLLVCANVGHLLMVRTERRRTEISLRLALGSTFGSLTRQLLMESLLLTALGTGLGWLLATWGRHVLWNLRPPMLLNAQPDLSFDGRVLLFTLGLALITALLASLGPFLRVAQVPLSTVLRDARPIPGSSRLWTARGFLVVLQIALSLAALIVSGLFVASLEEARAVDAGFAVDRLGVLSYNLGTLGYDADRGLAFHRRALEAASSLPGVQGAALATVRPFHPRFSGFLRTVVVEGQDLQDPQNGQLITTNFVSDRYFESFGIPILEGRDFTASDRAGEHRVAIVNETLADELWPGADPLGRRLFVRGVDGPCEVVGVARESKYNSVGESPLPYLYLPLEQNYSERVQLFVRTQGSPQDLLATLQSELKGLDPDLPWTHLATMADEKEDSLWALRLAALLLGVFGAVSTLLAAVGILGVMSYSVNLRRQELGVRMALGAARRRLVGMIVRQGMVPVMVGILVGWGATALFSRLLSNLLFGVGGLHLVTFLTTAAILAFVALVSNLLPAGRAISMQPVKALRDE